MKTITSKSKSVSSKKKALSSVKKPVRRGSKPRLKLVTEAPATSTKARRPQSRITRRSLQATILIFTLMALFLLFGHTSKAASSSKAAKKVATTTPAAATPPAKSTANSLGTLGNEAELMEKAQPTVPANTYRVIQARAIDRTYRSEIGLSLGAVTGGDSYYQTQNIGLQYDFHLGPHWSLGVRHQRSFNKLTPEGQRVFDRAEAMAQAGNNAYTAPALDYPISTSLATISFYPLYGKISWFESTVSYFDFYVMAGGGVTELKSGNTSLATGGGGMGMWWNQTLTSRLELRYQTYNDQIFSGPRKIEGAVATFTMGILL